MRQPKKCRESRNKEVDRESPEPKFTLKSGSWDSGRIHQWRIYQHYLIRESAVPNKRVALGFLGALLMTEVAVAAPLPNLVGHAYDQARARMIKLGYQPVQFLRTEDGCLLDKACKRYPELIDCQPAPPRRCHFAFVDRRHREYLVITTRDKYRRVENVTVPSRRDRSRWPMIHR